MGIGKTFYLHYFLWVLFTRQTSIINNIERKIYLQRSNRRIYSFRGDKTVSIDAGVAEGTVLYDSNCILLVDMVEEKQMMRKDTEYVAEYGLPNINRLRNAQYNDTDANSLQRFFVLPDDYELQCNGAVSNLPIVFDDIATVKIEKEEYYQLKKRNFASIDSFSYLIMMCLPFR